MGIEIISIGNEVLRGFTTNTNAAYLAERLTLNGFEVDRCTVVSDEAEALAAVLREAVERADAVIATGGLGPTTDDVTRGAVAKLYGCGLRYDSTVAKDLEMRFGSQLKTLDDQATIPEEAVAWLNPLGTAPALLFEREGRVLIVLPGVPDEMRALFEGFALPYLLKRKSSFEKRHFVVLHFVGLVEADMEQFLRALQQESPRVEFGIYPTLGGVSIRLSSYEEKDLAVPVERISSAFAAHRIEEESVELAIHRRFVERGWTLSVAESCTGGALAARITFRPGASAYFLGSVVAYNNGVKTALLGVSSKTLEKRGAVSEEVVKEMAVGAIARTGSDFSVAVSGVAGPTGGSKDKPVGMVWCSICRKGQAPIAWEERIRGNRERVIHGAVAAVLNKLYFYTL